MWFKLNSRSAEDVQNLKSLQTDRQINKNILKELVLGGRGGNQNAF